MRTDVLIYTRELKKDPTLLCPGTLLSEDIIITAATCFDAALDDLDDFTIVAGDLQPYLAGQPNTADKIGVQGVSIHPHYEHVPGEEPVWNMAIVQLKTRLNLETSTNMEAAMLPPPGMKYTGKSVQLGGLEKALDGSIMFHEKKLIVSPDTNCFDELEEGTFSPNEMFCGITEENSTSNQKAGSCAIYRGWAKPLVLGMTTCGSAYCHTHAVVQHIEPFLPWIFRETRLRPLYEVYDDDKFFEEFHQDLIHYSSLCLNGHLSDLAPLLVGRRGHGCGGYYRQGTGTQVLLVAGGVGDNRVHLSSTEQLDGESASWKTTTSLPRAVYGVVGISLDNTVYMTGGYDEKNDADRDEILAWDADREDWVMVGMVKVARSYHALSTVNMRELIDYCD